MLRTCEVQTQKRNGAVKRRSSDGYSVPSIDGIKYNESVFSDTNTLPLQSLQTKGLVSEFSSDSQKHMAYLLLTTIL